VPIGQICKQVSLYRYLFLEIEEFSKHAVQISGNKIPGHYLQGILQVVEKCIELSCEIKYVS